MTDKTAKRRLKLLCCLAAIMIACTGCMSEGNVGSDSSQSTPESSESSQPEESQSSSDSEEISSEEDVVTDDTVSINIKDEKLKAAYEALRGEFSEYWLSMSDVVTEQQLEEMYYINPEDIEEFVGEMSIANVSGDTLVMVKAKPGKAQTVAEALERRRKDIIDQFAQYPVNFMDIKSEAAKVITEGDYVFLVLMGYIDVADGEEATLDMAQAEVERAEKAILSAF